MPLDTTAIQSLAFLTEGGTYQQPADSGLGGLYRPFAKADPGSAVATLETVYDFWMNAVFNPDQALAMDPDFRNKIWMHPDVQADFRKREFTVGSFPETIAANPKSKSPERAKALAEYANAVWAGIPETTLLYEGMQQAVMDGGVALEFIWHREANGLERPVRWQAIHNSRIVMDRLGNMALLTRTEPVWGAYVAANPQWAATSTLKFPAGKFLYHIYRKMTGSWGQPDLEGYQYFGQGEDVPLYYLVTFDIFGLRMRMKSLEKYGMPPVDIYYPDNTGPSRLRRIADSVRNESVTTIPHPVGIEIDKMWRVVHREFPKLSFDAFENLSQWTSKRVSRIMLGSAEEGEKSEGKGGYSDHVSRRESGPQVFFQRDAKRISETINVQLMPAIIRQIAPGCAPEDMPVHQLQPKEERDRKEELELLEGASQLIDISQAEAYERLGYKRPTGADPIVKAPAPPMPPGMGGKPPGMGGKPPGGGDKGGGGDGDGFPPKMPKAIGFGQNKSSAAFTRTMPRDGSV